MNPKEAFDDLARRIIVNFSVAYVAMIIIMSIVADAGIALVFIGTIPFLFYLVLFFAMYLYDYITKPAVWIAPLLFPIIFLMIWSSGSVPIVSGMMGPTLFVLNVLFSYGMNAFFFFMQKKIHEMPKRVQSQDYHKWADYYHKKAEFHMHEAEQLKKQVDHYKKQSSVSGRNFQTQLRGIEDKCKALNFAIGRVYSNKHGGNPEVRDQIKIDKELYNSFSDMATNFEEHDVDYLLEVLTKLYMKLTALEVSEEKLLGKKVLLEYDGNQRMIDLLNQLDKDPVLEYYEEAKEVCTNLIAYLKHKHKK